MRIAELLTEFLYTQKYLHIQGIGTFTLDPSLAVPEPTDKNIELFLQQIQFAQVPITQNDDALIDFIRSKTGKIRPLAIADLDSLLSEYKGFLNLGKPLYIEGIGNLRRLRTGKIEFTPGAPVAEQIDLYNDDQKKALPKERKETVKKTPADRSISKANYKKILVITAGIAGFMLLLAGGYFIYEQTKNNSDPKTIQPTSVVVPAKADTVSAKPVSLPPASTTTSTPPATVAIAVPDTSRRTFKFVLQKTANKEAATSNFKGIGAGRPEFSLESKDTTEYRVIYTIACKPADTARIKDSLNFWYWGKRDLRVYIQQ